MFGKNKKNTTNKIVWAESEYNNCDKKLFKKNISHSVINF